MGLVVFEGRERVNLFVNKNPGKKDHVMTQDEVSYLQIRKETKSIMDFPVSRIFRNKFLLFKSPGLWYFVMATQVD